MQINEEESFEKLILPALRKRGWTDNLIRSQDTTEVIEIIDGKLQKGHMRADLILCIQVEKDSQPFPIALIEAKSPAHQPSDGIQQAEYSAQRLNLPFAFSTNGYLFVELDRFSKSISPPTPFEDFPSPNELRFRYEQKMGFDLASPTARPLLLPYSDEHPTPRYHQDAAIRAVLESIAQNRKRILVAMPQGTGVTFVASTILKRLDDAGQLRNALCLFDRIILRDQVTEVLQRAFGSGAVAVFSTTNPQRNARVLTATYQSLKYLSVK